MVLSESVKDNTMTSQCNESHGSHMKASNSQQEDVSRAEQIPAPNGTVKAAEASEQGEKLAVGPKEKQLSGKEKKGLAKAEKVARRAAEKQKQQAQPTIDLVAGNKGEIPKDSEKKGAPGQGTLLSKSQHKKMNSTSAGAQSSLPNRQAPPYAAPVPIEPEKENKNVALFDHLYGHSRRNTVAGAGKDVHPAVLALGMQIRNYIICGSSARCVAMLLVFKRVGVVSTVDMCIIDLHTGH